MLKRGYDGTFHHFNPKRTDRYVNEFSGRHNIRDLDTVDQMGSVATGMAGKVLRFRDLIALQMGPEPMVGKRSRFPDSNEGWTVEISTELPTAFRLSRQLRSWEIRPMRARIVGGIPFR